MRTLAIIICFTVGLSSAIPALANRTETTPASETAIQCDTTGRDTVYIRDTVCIDTIMIFRYGNHPNHRVDTRVLMWDYGISTYLHKGTMNLPTELKDMDQRFSGSFNFNLHLFRQIIRMDSIGRINFDYGFSLDFHRHRFSGDATIQRGQDRVTFTESPGVIMKKNTLNYQMLNMPVYLTFKFKAKDKERRRMQNNFFRLSLGGHFGVILSSWTKNKAYGEKRQRRKGNYNLNRIRYGLSMRFGYGYFNVFAHYSLSTLFKKSEQGPYDLQPFSFGIALIPW